MHPQMLSRVLKTPQSLPRISPCLGAVVSGSSEPVNKLFIPSPRASSKSRTKPLRPWTTHRRCIHGRAGESVDEFSETGIHTCKTAVAQQQQQQQRRELRARPKPLNSSSNQRPTPASDIMPSAGAKLKLGPPPPLLQHMSVRNLSSQRRTQTTKTTLGNNPTAETNNGDGVRAAGIDAEDSRDEQPRNTSSQSKSHSRSPAACTTTTTTTTNQPHREAAYLARQSVIIHTQEPQPIPVHSQILTAHRLVLHREVHDPDLFPSSPIPAPPVTPAPTAPFAFARACRNESRTTPGALSILLFSPRDTPRGPPPTLPVPH